MFFSNTNKLIKFLSELKQQNFSEISFHFSKTEFMNSLNNYQLKLQTSNKEYLLLVKDKKILYVFIDKSMSFDLSLNDLAGEHLKSFMLANLFLMPDVFKNSFALFDLRTNPLQAPVETKNLKWLELTTDFTLKAIEKALAEDDLILQGSLVLKRNDQQVFLRINLFNIDYLFEFNEKGNYIVTVFDSKMGATEAKMLLDYPFYDYARPSFDCAIKLVNGLSKVF